MRFDLVDVVRLIGGLAFAAISIVVLVRVAEFMDFSKLGPQSDPLKELNVVNHRDPRSNRLKSGYMALARFEDIHAGRYVYFKAYVPVERLLKPGELPPASSAREVFALARANAYAQSECERLLVTVARECAVDMAKGDNRGRFVRVEARLHFVQQTEFGTLDPQATWSYQQGEKRLVENGGQTSAAAAETDRMDLYRKARRGCEEIKRLEGNCAITRISIRMDERRNQFLIGGVAEYGFLVRQDG